MDLHVSEEGQGSSAPRLIRRKREDRGAADLTASQCRMCDAKARLERQTAVVVHTSIAHEDSREHSRQIERDCSGHRATAGG